LQRHAHARASEQSFAPIDHTGPIALRRHEVPVQLAAVFISNAGHPHHTPHLLFPSPMTQQPGTQLVHSQAIRLRPAVAALDLDARRVDHDVLDALAD
jgi:hypothetical protein